MPPVKSTKEVTKPDTAGKKSRRRSVLGSVMDDDDADDDDSGVGKISAKLDVEEQLQLTDAELKQEISRVLTGDNPQVTKNVIMFSYKDLCFKPYPFVEHMITHLEIPARLAHKESDEAKLMHQRQTGTGIFAPRKIIKTLEDGTEVEEEESVGKKVQNKFNFCDRAAQTYNNPIRTRGTQTMPPSRRTVNGSVSQWEIYDSYYARQEAEEKAKGKPLVPAKSTKGKATQQKTVGSDVQGGQLVRVTMPVKTMERMITQNIFDEILQDFKYWEDVADEYRDGEGVLLPLWKFTHDSCKALAVTSLTWSPRYKDLFAASYGSYDYMKQLHGMICVFSLKNPSFPEYLYMIESGVLSIDINPDLPHLLAAGFYDGTVAVYSLKDADKMPRYTCNAKEGKHHDPVWQVKWQKDNLDGNLNFMSVSSDGRITNWILQKTAIVYNDILQLNIETPLMGPEGTHLDIKGCGTSVAFHRTRESMFLVGTEEGNIYRCSKVYSNRFLTTYSAHSMAVYRIQWNPFHPNIFISCSADWRVKIWNYTDTKPYFTFDLGCPVGDVAWSPYGATVFAAGAADGKVYIYDLHINKYKPLCEQIVVQKKNTRLTSLAFNATYPVLLAGDSRGCVTSLKLSPNLRRALKENKTNDPVKFSEMEVTKLNKILAVVRDAT